MLGTYRIETSHLVLSNTGGHERQSYFVYPKALPNQIGFDYAVGGEYWCSLLKGPQTA